MPTATINGTELYFEEHGAGTPLLCIMGFATDSIGWTMQTPEFAKRHRTIVFDNRGVGRSAKPAGPYAISAMADETAGLLDHLGIARTHVLGLSMGGMIAQELALRHPQKVDRLVLAATHPRPDDHQATVQRDILAGLGGTVSDSGQVSIDTSNVNPMAFFQQLLPLVFTPEFINTQLMELMQMFAGALQHGVDLNAIMAQAAAIQNHDTLDRLGKIAAPTMVLHGDADRLILPKNGDLLAGKIPGAKLVKMANGSHGFNFEQRDLFNKTVLDFLGGAA